MNQAIVIVTYNRLALLKRCVSAISRLTIAHLQIYIVDNASTDGTREWLNTLLSENPSLYRLVTLPSNTGGAGGFSAGLKAAIDAGCGWVWMMDDDAEPYPQALEELLKVIDDTTNVYGSLATSGKQTSWETTLIGPPSHIVTEVIDVPPLAKVESLPFLGFMIHRDLVKQIGLPDADYFIAADDIEYCVRAQRAGAELYVVGQSRIEHPKTQSRCLHFFGHRIMYLSLVPWKRYYDTRNRLLIARKYYGLRLITQTIPGSFMRLYAALRYEPRKFEQLWAWCCGMFDGLLGIKGKRHAEWGIRA